VVHWDSARTWELYLDEMREAGTLRLSADPGRNDHKADELTKRHFRQVVTMLEELSRTDGCELLAIGGPRPELPRFLDFLPSDLRGRVAGTFTVDEATFTVGDVKQQASAIVGRYERSEEEGLVAETSGDGSRRRPGHSRPTTVLMGRQRRRGESPDGPGWSDHTGCDLRP
jgi:Bacterial archaeo-eukaryotic release factor family 10